MNTLWACPRCSRTFRQRNQRHASGTGDLAALLARQPPALLALCGMLDAALAGCDDVERVARDRHVLFRGVRIFADLVFMRDALRLAIHLRRRVGRPDVLQGRR